MLAYETLLLLCTWKPLLRIHWISTRILKTKIDRYVWPKKMHKRVDKRKKIDNIVHFLIPYLPFLLCPSFLQLLSQRWASYLPVHPCLIHKHPLEIKRKKKIIKHTTQQGWWIVKCVGGHSLLMHEPWHKILSKSSE